MKIVKLTFIVLMLCSQLAAMALGIKELTLEEKSSRSDLVFIGQAASADAIVKSRVEQVALVRIETRLKGSAQGLVKVRYRGSISELDADCCDLGKKYIFFLRLGRDGIYESVNGRFGILRIDDDSSR